MPNLSYLVNHNDVDSHFREKYNNLKHNSKVKKSVKKEHKEIPFVIQYLSSVVFYFISFVQEILYNLFNLNFFYKIIFLISVFILILVVITLDQNFEYYSHYYKNQKEEKKPKKVQFLPLPLPEYENKDIKEIQTEYSSF